MDVSQKRLLYTCTLKKIRQFTDANFNLKFEKTNNYLFL